jgi:hypothetical protein
MLGGEANRVHQQVDALLDSADGMIVLIDGSRAISYAHGLRMSPCQLELLLVEIERAVRNVGGASIGNKKKRRTDGGRRIDESTESIGAHGSGNSNSGIAASCVLRLAKEAAATDAG